MHLCDGGSGRGWRGARSGGSSAMSGGVFWGCVSDVGGSDSDDLRVDIGECMRRVLDENRRRRRAKRHRRVELSKDDIRERSCNCLLFFYFPSCLPKRPRSVPSRPHVFSAHMNPTGTHSQSRRIQSCTFSFTSHDHLTDRQTDRVALRLDSNDHIYWLYQKLASTHVHQVRLSLLFH